MTPLSRVVSTVVLVFCCSYIGFAQVQKIIFKNNGNSPGLTERLSDTGCTTPNGNRGECISILNCTNLMHLITKPDQRQFLKQSQCGWDGDSPLVCCDDESSVNTERDCTTSELRWCTSEKDDCCIPELTFNINEQTSTTIQPTNSNQCQISSTPSDLTSGCCGVEASNLKIIPGEILQIDQHPWTALIEYAGSGITQMRCGGALITGRYVLTAAHCLFIDDWTPISVRLGDFDIGNPGIDCVTEGDSNVCTDGEVTILIDSATAHPDYNVNIRSQSNDIAIIRLKDNAPYTDFIRPICLPSSYDFTESADNQTRLHVAGWGIMRDGQIQSQLKRQEKLYFVTVEDCFMSYRQLTIMVGDGHICAGGRKNKEWKNQSCNGDSGGALMLRNNQRTELVGIASLSSCGRTRPAMYTKVFHYLTWIRSNIY